NAREWQKKAVIDFGKISQSMRFLNYLVLVTIPVSLFLEKQSRFLITMQFDAVRTKIDPTAKKFYDNRGEFKMYIFEPGMYEGQIFRKFMRATYHHKEVPFKYVYFKIPPENWQKTYENLKKPFVFDQYEKMRNELAFETEKEEVFRNGPVTRKFIGENIEKKGIWLKCQSCGHSWQYTGTMTRYTHCPSCGSRVNIPKSKITEEAKTK
ncbi:MAG: hypothetical protein ACP5L4_07015, partial [Thermoplasmata archaeon]